MFALSRERSIAQSFQLSATSATQFEWLVGQKRVYVADVGDFNVQRVARGGVALVCPRHPPNVPVCVLFLSTTCIHCPSALQRTLDYAQHKLNPHILLMLVVVNQDPTLLQNIQSLQIDIMPIKHTPALQLYFNGEPRIANPGDESDIATFVTYALNAFERERTNMPTTTNSLAAAPVSDQSFDGDKYQENFPAQSTPQPPSNVEPTRLFNYRQFGSGLSGQSLVYSNNDVPSRPR